MEPVAGVSSVPVAIFRAITVRDASAHARDGDPVFAVRRLGEDLLEVLFGDGIWMLCAPSDIEPSPGRIGPGNR